MLQERLQDEQATRARAAEALSAEKDANKDAAAREALLKQELSYTEERALSSEAALAREQEASSVLRTEVAHWGQVGVEKEQHLSRCGQLSERLTEREASTKAFIWSSSGGSFSDIANRPF